MSNVVWTDSDGEPKRWDRRVRRGADACGQAWFWVETFTTCDCPNCDADGHWQGTMGTPDRQEALEAVKL